MKRLILGVLLAAACGDSSTPPAQPLPAETIAMVEGGARAPDDVELVYDVRGRGDTALVFIHGWSCNRTFWKDQVDAFAKDYRVVALDLGGHGESGDNRTAWTIASLGGDVQAVVEKLALPRVILVGHSMGGPVALDAARRMPGRVVGVVGVDTLHDVELKAPPEMKKQVLDSFANDFVGTTKIGMSYMFRPDADKAVVEWVGAQMGPANPAVGVPLMRELYDHDLAPALAAAKVPIRSINAAPYGPTSPATNVAANKKHADFDAVIMDGVGHFLHLEKPAEFNARLVEVLATWRRE
jgi:pimeloyl-ACP methyl ester carboxylesterase